MAKVQDENHLLSTSNSVLMSDCAIDKKELVSPVDLLQPKH